MNLVTSLDYYPYHYSKLFYLIVSGTYRRLRFSERVL
nr:MAG TPA: hypothetical protein [Caudoviricetes sp.]